MTIMLCTFIPCSAKAVIIAMITDTFFPDSIFMAPAMYFLGIAVIVLAGIALKKTGAFAGDPAPFVMELPAYHLPAPKALALHVYDKGKHFVIKAFTIIFLSTVAIWFLSNFSWGWEMVPEEQSILHDLGQFIAPIFTPCGFGVQTGDYGWTFSVASIQGIVAKEAVTQTIEQISGSLIEGGDFSMLVSNSGITQGGLVGFAVFNMLTIPCFASVATAKGELKDHKTFVWTILFWVGLSYLLGCLAYVSVDYVWSLGITIPALIAAGVGLYFYDRHMNKKEAMAN
ncbi:MAG TPA: hypothetical protein DEF61_02890 [Firmicutes bacterium]|nr:hypothetical protein [Bacillota bacterium]